MKGVSKRCRECGRALESLSVGAADGARCPACGAALEDDALSAFADRLARFGLADTRAPLVTRVPELPNAE